AIGVFLLIAFVLPLFSAGATNSISEGSQTSRAAEITPNWTVDHDQSGIWFSGTHDGSEYEGEFGDWSADIQFDPDNIDDARALVTIQMMSTEANRKLYTDSLRSAEWFFADQYRTATADLSNFRRMDDDDEYVADLTLSIKDKSVTVPFNFELDIDEDEARMKGEATVQRTPLDLGQKSDPSADWVGEDVLIEVEVRASPAG
ncbi:MAG: YceI family protein, partial [Henriciella sp.]|uniref:YceI family protein n=1 Tax=Henriciella sp. TaxID=1968823 RepID=UPI003C727229